MSARSSGLPALQRIQWLIATAIFVICMLPTLTTSAPLVEQTTETETYYPVADATGCYYNFQHYDEGDRIITNEPCLNCTCHNRMLMCYLRVCPFIKAIGENCKVEKKPDQCCPIITCPEVPVHLLPSSPPLTAVGHLDTYGCTIDRLFYSDGARVPSDPNKPCELCYCIRNKTACVMQECTLHIEGCKPVYQDGVCCPVRYDCDHPEEDELPAITDEPTTTTVRSTTLAATTPGLILGTTIPPGGSTDCLYEGEIYADGILVKKDVACEQCYCMKGDIVCAVQECGPTPLDKVNCKALAIKEGQCCPDAYDCEHVKEMDLTTAIYELTTLQPDIVAPAEDQEPIIEHVPEVTPTKTEPEDQTESEFKPQQEPVEVEEEEDEPSKQITEQPEETSEIGKDMEGKPQEVTMPTEEAKPTEPEDVVVVTEGIAKVPQLEQGEQVTETEIPSKQTAKPEEIPAVTQKVEVIPETTVTELFETKLPPVEIESEKDTEKPSIEIKEPEEIPASEKPSDESTEVPEPSKSEEVTLESEHVTEIPSDSTKKSITDIIPDEAITEGKPIETVTEGKLEVPDMPSKPDETLTTQPEEIVSAVTSSEQAITQESLEEEITKEPAEASPEPVTGDVTTEEKLEIITEKEPIHKDDEELETPETTESLPQSTLAEESKLDEIPEDLPILTESKEPSTEAAIIGLEEEKEPISESTTQVPKEEIPLDSTQYPLEKEPSEEEAKPTNEPQLEVTPAGDETIETEATSIPTEQVTKTEEGEKEEHTKPESEIPEPPETEKETEIIPEKETEATPEKELETTYKTEDIPAKEIEKETEAPLEKTTEEISRKETPVTPEKEQEEPTEILVTSTKEEATSELPIELETLQPQLEQDETSESISDDHEIVETEKSPMETPITEHIELMTEPSISVTSEKSETEDSEITSVLTEKTSIDIEVEPSEKPLEEPAITEEGLHTPEKPIGVTEPEQGVQSEVTPEEQPVVPEKEQVELTEQPTEQPDIAIITQRIEMQTSSLVDIESTTSATVEEVEEASEPSKEESPITDHDIIPIEETTLKIKKPLEDAEQPSVTTVAIVTEKESETPISVKPSEDEAITSKSEEDEEKPLSVTETIEYLETSTEEKRSSTEALKPMEVSEPEKTTSTLIIEGPEKSTEKETILTSTERETEEGITERHPSKPIEPDTSEPAIVDKTEIPIDQQTEIFDEHIIPGEGSCLVDGQTYGNNTSVPPINHCQISCKCFSSILQCETVTCSPAPSNLLNCMPVYPGPDSCCPTYSCSEPESPDIESDSHKMEDKTDISPTITTMKPTEGETPTPTSQITEAPFNKSTVPPAEEPEGLATDSTEGGKLPSIQPVVTEPSVQTAKPVFDCESGTVCELPTITEPVEEPMCAEGAQCEPTDVEEVPLIPVVDDIEPACADGADCEIQEQEPTEETKEEEGTKEPIDEIRPAITDKPSVTEGPKHTEAPSIGEECYGESCKTASSEESTKPSPESEECKEDSCGVTEPLKPTLETTTSSDKIPIEEIKDVEVTTTIKEPSIIPECHDSEKCEKPIFDIEKVTVSKVDEAVTESSKPALIPGETEQEQEDVTESILEEPISEVGPEEADLTQDEPVTEVKIEEAITETEPELEKPIDDTKLEITPEEVVTETKPAESITEIKQEELVTEGEPEAIVTEEIQEEIVTDAKSGQAVTEVVPEQSITEDKLEQPVTEEKQEQVTEGLTEKPIIEEVVPEISMTETEKPLEDTELNEIEPQSTDASVTDASKCKEDKCTEIPADLETGCKEGTDCDQGPVTSFSPTQASIEEEGPMTEAVVPPQEQPEESTEIKPEGTELPDYIGAAVTETSPEAETSKEIEPVVEPIVPTVSDIAVEETEEPFTDDMDQHISKPIEKPTTESTIDDSSDESVTKSEEVSEDQTPVPSRPSEEKTETLPRETIIPFRPVTEAVEEETKKPTSDETEQLPTDAGETVLTEKPVDILTPEEPEVVTDRSTSRPELEMGAQATDKPIPDLTKQSQPEETVPTTEPFEIVTSITVEDVNKSEAASTVEPIEIITSITVADKTSSEKPAEDGQEISEQPEEIPESTEKPADIIEELPVKPTLLPEVTTDKEQPEKPQETISASEKPEESITEEDKLVDVVSEAEKPTGLEPEETSTEQKSSAEIEISTEKESETSIESGEVTTEKTVITVKPEESEGTHAVTEEIPAEPSTSKEGMPVLTDIETTKAEELYTSAASPETTSTAPHIPGELSTSAIQSVEVSKTTSTTAAVSEEEITTVASLPVTLPSATPSQEDVLPEQKPESPDYQIPSQEEDYDDDQTAFGPGTCRYGGKVYVSAQQIPRDDPCDFCFCFRSDIICLQQSCPPPIPRCHEEPIRGFCCPRYECPVSMATSVNITTTTSTTTTTVPPHFLSSAYKGRAKRSGCLIRGQSYDVGDQIDSASGPCLQCICGGDGQMKCDPKVCSPQPILQQIIKTAASRRRR